MISTASRLVKNVGFNIVADLSTKLANALLILMISNFLGIATLGAYSIAVNFFNLGLLFSYWGLGNLLIREVSKEKHKVNKYLSNFVFIRLVFAIVIIIAINVVARNLNYSEQTQQIIQIISYSILASTLTNLFYSLFIAFEKIKYLSIVSLTVSLLRLVISFILLLNGRSIIVVARLYTVLEYLAVLICLVFVRKERQTLKPEIDIQFSLNQILSAFPLFLVALLVVMDSRMEILIISFFLNEFEVGYFTAMNTIIGGLSLFSEALRNAIFPVFARYQKDSPEILRRVNLILGKYIALTMFPLSIGCYFLADKLIALLFGAAFEISAALLQIVIWTLIGYSFTVVAIRLLMVTNQEKRVVLSLFISASLTISLNFLLVERNGIMIVAVVRLITSYVLTILCCFFTWKSGYPAINLSAFIKIIISGSIFFLSTLILKQIDVVLAIVIGVVIYGFFVWAMKLITTKDIVFAKEVLSGIFDGSSIKR